jgi:hypothetical protein
MKEKKKKKKKKKEERNQKCGGREAFIEVYPQRAPPATYLQHLAGGHLGPRFSPNYPEALATSEVR